MKTNDPDPQDDFDTEQPAEPPRPARDRPDFEALVRLIADERRQDIVDILSRDGPQTLDQLVDRLIDPRPESGGDRTRERIAVYADLHWHFTTHGVAEWDGHYEDVISPGPAFEHAVRMLHGLRDGYSEAEAGGESA